MRLCRLGHLARLLLLAAPAAASASPAQPGRIVSMNPCLDSILLAVADAGQVAAISHWSHDPAATSTPLTLARRFPAHGGTAEEVLALRADLVLLSPHTPLATRAALERLGIPMLALGAPADIAESLAQVRAVAAAAGHRARGEALAAQIAGALAAARRPGTPRPALIRLASGLVPGEGTLPAALMANSGLRNMASTYGLGPWGMLPLEPLAFRPPPLLLTDLPQTRHPVLARLGIPTYSFPARLLNCGGPSMAPAAARLAAIRDSLP